MKVEAVTVCALMADGEKELIFQTDDERVQKSVGTSRCISQFLEIVPLGQALHLVDTSVCAYRPAFW